MNAEELKHKIKAIFGEQINFNKEFDLLAEEIKNIDSSLLSWCEQVRDKKILPVTGSVLGDKIAFIKKIGSSNRCIILNGQNNQTLFYPFSIYQSD